MTRACLFDLDGVIFDTEPQYTVFWRQVGRRFHPEIPDFEYQIKGQTLAQIYERYFHGQPERQAEITKMLDDYEMSMDYRYVPGAREYIERLQKRGIKTAVVTSSNLPKMNNVYRHHPDFTQLFDKVFTSEDLTESKPSPHCYLKAAAYFNLDPKECVVFEDSYNGLKAGTAAGARVIALATTNPLEKLKEYTSEIINDFTEMI